MVQPDPENLRLIHKEVSERSARLYANSSALDTKAATLLGFTLAVSTLVAAHAGLVWLKILAFVAFGFAAWFGIGAMALRKFKEAPEPQPLWDQMKSRGELATLAVVTQAKLVAFAENKKIHESKARSWRLSLVALTLAVILSVVALAIGNPNDGRSVHHERPGPTVSHPK